MTTWSTTPLTLTDLESAGFTRWNAYIAETGGGVVALALKVDGEDYLLALDDGRHEGLEWTMATDSDTRETLGELESPAFPVTSDADQTLADAVAWARHVASGGGPEGPTPQD